MTEKATYINELDQSLPDTTRDLISDGDDHIRLIKATLLQTFPAFTPLAIEYSDTELNLIYAQFYLTKDGFDCKDYVNDVNLKVKNIVSIDDDTAVEPRVYNDARYHMVESDGGLAITPRYAAIFADVNPNKDADTGRNVVEGPLNIIGEYVDSFNGISKQSIFIGEVHPIYGNTYTNNSAPLVLKGSNITLDMGDSIPTSDQNLIMEDELTSLLNKCWPVGSIYSNAVSTDSPDVLMGWPSSSWEPFGEGKLVRSPNYLQTPGESVDGSTDVVLTEYNIPKHNHRTIGDIGFGNYADYWYAGNHISLGSEAFRWGFVNDGVAEEDPLGVASDDLYDTTYSYWEDYIYVSSKIGVGSVTINTYFGFDTAYTHTTSVGKSEAIDVTNSYINVKRWKRVL